MKPTILWQVIFSLSFLGFWLVYVHPDRNAELSVAASVALDEIKCPPSPEEASIPNSTQNGLWEWYATQCKKNNGGAIGMWAAALDYPGMVRSLIRTLRMGPEDVVLDAAAGCGNMILEIMRHKRHMKACLKIQPTWRGAVVRSRLRKHKLIENDIDIDGFEPVTLEERYTTLPTSDAAHSSAMELIAASIVNVSIAPAAVYIPIVERPRPMPTMASVPITRPTVMVDAWLTEQVRPGMSMQSVPIPTMTPNKVVPDDEAGWGSVMDQFRKRNKNMTKNKYDKVDPMRKFEQMNRKPTSVGHPSLQQSSSVVQPRAVVVDDCDVTSVSSKGTGGGGGMGAVAAVRRSQSMPKK